MSADERLDLGYRNDERALQDGHRLQSAKLRGRRRFLSSRPAPASFPLAAADPLAEDPEGSGLSAPGRNRTTTCSALLPVTGRRPVM
jgi:hypothetical protein